MVFRSTVLVKVQSYASVYVAVAVFVAVNGPHDASTVAVATMSVVDVLRFRVAVFSTVLDSPSLRFTPPSVWEPQEKVFVYVCLEVGRDLVAPPSYTSVSVAVSSILVTANV